jgi:hypothetical protein
MGYLNSSVLASACDPRIKEVSTVNRRLSGLLSALWVGSVVTTSLTAQEKPLEKAAANPHSLVFADFEHVESGRPVTARGGLIQLFGYEESKVHKSEFKGAPGVDPPAPELVHIKAGDPNHAMKFEYALHAPNPWTGVTVEMHGLPDADSKAVPEDLSGYKMLSLQVFATGIEILRLEAVSRSRGKDSSFAWPVMTFQVRQGFNTYRVPLSGFSQPAWAPVRVDPKSIFKELTSINLTAFCDQCEFSKQGMVIVDNVVFEK